MKKIVLLLMATFAFAYITKAKPVPDFSGAKKQFVFWSKLPAKPAVVSQPVSWLNSAMTAQQITGASVRATANNYIQVWGASNYQTVLQAIANPLRWSIVKSKGGEKNYAIDSATGQSVLSGNLKSGVDLLALDGVPVAKIGENFCMNAVEIQQASYVNENDDPDNDVSFAGGAKKSPIGPGAGNVNNITVNGTTGTGQNQELSWNTGYAVYSMGRNDRQTDLLVDAAIFKQIQDMKQCCGQTAQPAPVTLAPTSMYLAAAPVPAVTSGNLDVTLRNKANANDWVNTGLFAVNTFFNGVNTYRGIRLENNRFVNNDGYGNVWGNNSTLFQGNNQPNYTNSGFGNGSGGNGWGNTWGSNIVATGYTTNPTIRPAGF